MATRDEATGPRGRGASDNPPNRFDRISVHLDERPSGVVASEYFEDSTRSIISHNASPDVGFEASLNPYRGCEHGCIYCYARPTHEHLGFSAGLDFESRIVVKSQAPELLRAELSRPRYQPKPLAMSGVTDPYQPVEKELRITRGCLEVLAEHRHPVLVITKGHLVTRDIDLLADLAHYQAAAVRISITTLDGDLSRRMEPRAPHPRERLRALKALSEAGIPCGVLVSPILPGLTEHEMPAILEAAHDAGATAASYILLRLPGAVAGLFEDWLTQHFPDRRERVLARQREIRSGQLNDSRFGHRMRGDGTYAEQISNLFRVSARRLGFGPSPASLSTAGFRRIGTQRTLFQSTD
ncbi:MAG: PA0069 family radical SAM protein [Thermoanaerobaculia bacterium]|nr:PA0069 family radical SAM protein [Thermoanaerobaculia bacterium]